MPGSSDREDVSAQQTIVLLEQIATQDRAALAALYDAYAARLYGLALMILKEADAAEDALQEVFLQIWKRADRFDETRGHPAAWLLRVCRNLCIDRLRGHARLTVNFASEWIESIGDAAPDSAPETQIETEELQLAVAGALDRLSLDQRRLVQLAYYEGQTQREIATTLDLPLGTVKTRMQKALRSLRGDLEIYAR